MKTKANNTPLIYIGGDVPQGSYVLRIHVRKRIAIAFGRVDRDKLIDMQPGEVLYIGSAMALKGPSCLANRLRRHATRTVSSKPHAIRTAMLREFPQVGLAKRDFAAPAGKTLHWNIDYLLEKPSVELVSVYLIRSEKKLESQIGDMLENDSATAVIEKGLGANDRSGHTYLRQVRADEARWDCLPGRLEVLRAAANVAT